MEDIYPLIQQSLVLKGHVSFVVSGVSMQPMLYNGRDTVTIVPPPKKLKKYDLPFFRLDNGKFVLHRVIKIHKDGTYECRGDNLWESEDNVRPDQIIGVVKNFTRKGKKISANRSLGYFLYTRTWVFLHHFKKYYKYITFLKIRFNNVKQRLKYFFNPIKLTVNYKDNKMEEIKFRKALPEDISSVQKLFVELVKYEKEKFGIETANSSWFLGREGKKAFNNLAENGFLWVAVCKGEIVGYASGKVSKNLSALFPKATLKNIYIKEDYRKYGIGSKFLEVFKEFCKENDCFYINVTFKEENIEAENFYKKHNFGINSKTYSCKLD